MLTKTRWVVGGTLLISGCTALGPLPYVDYSTHFAHTAGCTAAPSAKDGVAFCVDPNNPEPAVQPGVIDLIDARQMQYAQKAGAYSAQAWQVGYNTGITILALSAVATAVFTHGAARASWLAGIGIGAGTATAVWGWANPGIASDAYRLGAARAICLRVAAGGFDDSVHTTFVSDQNAVTEAATKLTDAMTNGNFLDAGLKSTDGPTAASATKANDSAATAQQAATTAQAGASQELAIYQQRGALVYGALRKIDDQVYAAVKGSAITYQTTVTSINQAAATAPAPASGARAPVVVVQEPTNTASAIVAVSTRAQNLTSAAATLSAEKPFSSAATAVTACTTLTN